MTASSENKGPQDRNIREKDTKFNSVASIEVLKREIEVFTSGKEEISESDFHNITNRIGEALEFCKRKYSSESDEGKKEHISSEMKDLSLLSTKIKDIFEGSLPAEPEYEGNEAFLRASKFGLDPGNRWFDEDAKGRRYFNHVKCGNDILEHGLKNKMFTEYHSGLIHPFVDDRYLKDGEPFLKSLIQHNADVDPQQIAKTIEYIKNRTRIVDPVKIGKTMEEVMPLPEDFIPLENGLFEVHTKTLHPHSPQYYYFSHIPRRYIPGGKSIEFKRFLETVFTGDPEKEKKIIQIYEVIAWTLTPGYIPQGSATFIGSGGEGKSIVISVIRSILGKDNVSSVSVQEIENDKFKRPELQGRFANITSEAGGIIKSEIFKRATDYSDITADRKNGGNFTFNSRAKWIMATNKLPETADNLRAFYRRNPVFIVFENYLEEFLSPVEIDKFDKALKSPDELDLIFSEVVDDYLLPFMERKKFTGQLTLEDSQKQYDKYSNPSQAYIQERADSGEITEDLEEAKELAEKKGIDTDLISKVDKQNGKEQLLTIKSFIERDARQWAKKNNLQADLINVVKLGKALETVGFRNMTCEKKIEKIPLRAWLGLFIAPVDRKIMSKSLKDEESTNSEDSKGRKTLEDYSPNQKDNNNGMMDNNTLRGQVALSENGVLPADPSDITGELEMSSTPLSMLPNIRENKKIDMVHPWKESATSSDINQKITGSNLVAPTFDKVLPEVLPEDAEMNENAFQKPQIKGNTTASSDLTQTFAIKETVMETAYRISNGKKEAWLSPLDILKNLLYSRADITVSLNDLTEKILPSMAGEGLVLLSNGKICLTGKKLKEPKPKEPDNQGDSKETHYINLFMLEDRSFSATDGKDYTLHKGQTASIPEDTAKILMERKWAIEVKEGVQP